jgi:malonyl-CoA O-methyltransferase
MADDDSTAARHLDGVAVQHLLERLACDAQAPWLHAEVARRMGQRLEIVRLRPDRLIDWWGGLGAGAAELERVHPQAARTIVEPTAAWLQRSRAAVQRPWWRAAASRRPAAQAMGQDDPALPAEVGLVWANMVLHAVVDPPALFARWHTLLAVDGFVMFSCLGPGTLRELRSLYQRLGWGPATPGFVDMHDLGDMLVQAGFADPVMDQETITLTWADPAALLAELRGLGGNAAPGRHAGLRTPRWRDRLLAELASLAGPDGRIALSFEVAYGHAFKGVPKPRPGEPTRVSLASMREMVHSSRGRGSS